jgi:hypothetical protein
MGSFTVSAWVNIDLDTGGIQTPVYKGAHNDSTAGHSFYVVENAGTYYLRSVIGDGTARRFSPQDCNFDLDDWVHYVFVVDRDNQLLRAYFNGSAKGTNDITPIASVDTAQALQFPRNPGAEMDGLLDEVHIASGVRSACWIKTEYNNQKENSTFYDVGGEENLIYRKQITIDHTKVACTSDISDFPMLVSIENDPDLRYKDDGGNVQDPEGDDIIFKASDGTTQLSHEVEKYDGTNGTLLAWVKIPSLKYNEDTFIYMDYGDRTITESQEDAAGVWDDNYVGVWHLKETGNGTADEYKDSTQYVNNGQGGEGNSLYIPTRVSNPSRRKSRLRTRLQQLGWEI